LPGLIAYNWDNFMIRPVLGPIMHYPQTMTMMPASAKGMGGHDPMTTFSLKRKRVFKRAGWLSLIVGILFLAFVSANPLGLVSAYPPLPDWASNDRPWGPIKPIQKVKNQYKKQEETQTEYYARLANRLFTGLGRFWSVDIAGWQPSDAAYTRVSPWDNYLLWAYSYLPGHEHFSQYEFAIPEKVINRGYGYCSQVARMVYYILRDQGMEATILSHPNHVLVRVKEGLIDANYGVFVPHSTEELKNNPALIDQYYTRIPDELDAVHKIFQGEWTIPDNHDELFAYMYRLEMAARIGKWVPPVLLIVLGLSLLVAGCFEIRNDKLEQVIPAITTVMESSWKTLRPLGLALPDGLIKVEVSTGPRGGPWKDRKEK